MLIKKMRDLHSGQGGQAIIFVVMVLFTLVTFMALVINVGHRTVEKVQIQNGLDGAALSGGNWVARGLNLACIMNVSQTQILTWIIFFNAFIPTVPAVYDVLHRNIAAAQAAMTFPPTAPAAAIWLTYLTTVCEAVWLPVMDLILPFIPPLVQTLWTLMRFCGYASDAIMLFAPAMANLSFIDILDVNIPDNSLGFFPVMFMPMTKGSFTLDTCQHTLFGGPGYVNFFEGRAPIHCRLWGIEWRVWITGVFWGVGSGMLPPAPSVYWGMVDLEIARQCQTTGYFQINNPERFALTCNDCEQNLGTSEWVGSIHTVAGNSSNAPAGRSLDLGTQRLSGGQILPNFVGPGALLPTGNLNTPSRYGPPVKRSAGGCSQTQRWEVNVTATQKRYYKEKWIMRECKYRIPVPPSQNASGKPRPRILKANWDIQTYYLGVTMKDIENQFNFGSTSSGGNPRATPATAMVKIYNASGMDNLFNQDWHVRLSPVRMDHYSIAFPGLSLPSPPGFGNYFSGLLGLLVLH